MILLDHKGKLEVLDVEGKVLAIEDAEHINLLHDCLNATLQLTDARLIPCILIKHVCNDLRGNRHLLREIYLLQGCRQQVLLSNRLLLLLIVASQSDNYHAVKEDLINLVDIVTAEDKHHLAEIDRHIRQILVLEITVLYGIREVNQHILHFLALGSAANLVELVEHENH